MITKQLAHYGWAPGLYIGHRCATCGKQFGEADKASWRCRACAEKAYHAARQAWPTGCHDTASCERHRVCGYHHCAHTGKGAALGAEIDAAIIHGMAPPPGLTDPATWDGRPIDEMTREEAIRALKTAVALWANHRARISIAPRKDRE